MFDLFSNWLRRRGNPIGIDFGGAALRLAQLHPMETGQRLHAAASYEWNAAEQADLEQASLEPDSAQNSAHIARFSQIVRHLMEDGGFAGCRAVVALPARWTHILSLQFPPMKRRHLRSAVRAAARDKLGCDPADTVMRSLWLDESQTMAGAMRHMLLLAAPRRQVQAMLNMLSQAKLRVVSLLPEPLALIEAYRHVYRRVDEAQRCCALIDIGGDNTRLTVCRAGALLHASRIEIGANQQAETSKTFPAAGEQKSMRYARATGSDGVETGGIAIVAPPRQPAGNRLSERVRQEIAAFNAASETKVEALIFTGGTARRPEWCAHIAEAIGVPHYIGDPLARVSRESGVAVAAGIDRRQPQPQWALAVGLSMGVPA